MSFTISICDFNCFWFLPIDSFIMSYHLFDTLSTNTGWFTLTLQTPKATLDVKELRADISKDAGSEAGLSVKLQLVPIIVFLGESRVTYDLSVTSGGCFSSNHMKERVCAPFSCEEFSLLCELGHDR